MPRPALRLKVSKKDQAALKKLLAGGIEQVRVVLRGRFAAAGRRHERP